MRLAATPPRADYEQVREVDYRGQFKPETVQLLSQLRASRDESVEGGEPLTQEALESCWRAAPRSICKPPRATPTTPVGSSLRTC